MARKKMTELEKFERRAKKLKLEQERNEIARLERNLEDLRRSFLTEPTYSFKVGDRVQRGNIDKSIVTEVLDKGKIYKLHEFVKGNGQNKKDYEQDYYASWINLRPYRSRDSGKSFSSEVENVRKISYYNSGLDSILSRFYDSYCGIDTEPDYQRELVWTLEDKVALIDSIFKKIDIGKFTFIKRAYKNDEKALEILDGKQRLNAIVEFYEDRFTYRGKTFTQLSWRDRHHFKSFNVSMGDTTPMTDQEKYEYFLRLNTGGKPQDQDHLNYVQGLLNNG